jgi:hypothetical protein
VDDPLRDAGQGHPVLEVRARRGEAREVGDRRVRRDRGCRGGIRSAPLRARRRGWGSEVWAAGSWARSRE